MKQKPLLFCFSSMLFACIFNCAMAAANTGVLPISENTCCKSVDSSKQQAVANPPLKKEQWLSLKMDRKRQPSDLIKLNFTQLLAKNLTLQYEFVYNKRIALALTGRYMLPTQIKKLPYIGSNAPLLISSWGVIPEARLYLGKRGAPRGIYLAPYFRYANATMKLDYPIQVSGNSPTMVTFKGKAVATKIGLLLGGQWLLSKHCTFDWWILGVDIGSTSFELGAKNDNGLFPQEIQDQFRLDLVEKLGHIPLYGTGFSIKAGPNELSVKKSVKGIGVRYPGLCLGYAF